MSHNNTFATVTRTPPNTVWFFLQGEPDVDTFNREFLAPLDALLDMGKPFTLVFNTLHINSISMKVAQLMVQWLKANKPRLQQHLQQSVLISDNEAVNAVVDFVFSLQPPVAPFRRAASPEDAQQLLA